MGHSYIQHLYFKCKALMNFMKFFNMPEVELQNEAVFHCCTLTNVICEEAFDTNFDHE